MLAIESREGYIGLKSAIATRLSVEEEIEQFSHRYGGWAADECDNGEGP